VHYYTFEIEGKKVGYYEEKDEDGVLYCNARMEMNGEKFENPFWIKHDMGNISAYKLGDGDYIEFKEKEGVFPSSAISLILSKVKPGTMLTYQIFNEGEGKVTGTATLEMTGNKIEEKMNGKLKRYFIMENGKVKTYCWGGTALSHKVLNKEEATKGTAWE